MGIINFTTFLLTSFLFIISPGIDTIFVLNKAIAQGKKSGIYSTLGITTGVLVHTTLAAFGLSLILSQSAMAFSFVKYAGAAYLVCLGIGKLLLGATYALMSLVWFMILTFFAGSLSIRLKQRPLFGVWLNKFSALVFVLMGVKIALTKR